MRQLDLQNVKHSSKQERVPTNFMTKIVRFNFRCLQWIFACNMLYDVRIPCPIHLISLPLTIEPRLKGCWLPTSMAKYDLPCSGIARALEKTIVSRFGTEFLLSQSNCISYCFSCKGVSSPSSLDLEIDCFRASRIAAAPSSPATLCKGVYIAVVSEAASHPLPVSSLDKRK